MIGIGLAVRRCRSASMFQRATGCSQYWMLKAARSLRVRLAVAGSQPWFASMRSATSGPTAARMARMRATSSARPDPSLALIAPKPMRRISSAWAAITSGASMLTVRSVTKDRFSPPSSA